MSSVSIPFMGDPAGALAALAMIRAEAAKGVQVNFTGQSAGYVGPNGQPAGVPSAPATFSNPGGNVFVPPSAAYVSPSSHGGTGGAAQGAGAMQFDRAAETMMAAARMMVQAAQRSGSSSAFGEQSGNSGESNGATAEAANESSGSGGRSMFGRRSGPFNINRITRYLSAGYVAFEALRLTEEGMKQSDENQFAEYQYGQGSQSAYVTKLRNDQTFNRSIPFWQISSWIAGKIVRDPTGRGRSIDERQTETIYDASQEMKDNESDANQLSSIAHSTTQRNSIDRATSTYSVRGVERSLAQVKNSFEDYTGNYQAELYSRQQQIDVPGREKREMERMQREFNTFKGEGDKSLDSRRREATAQSNEIVRLASERADSMGFSQGARNESSSIVLNAGDPRLGGIMAQTNDSRRSAEESALSIYRNSGILEGDKQGLASQALRGGELSIESQRASLLRDIQPQELDSINQQDVSGPATSDGSKAFEKMAEDLAELKNLEAQALPQILSILQGLKVQ